MAFGAAVFIAVSVGAITPARAAEGAISFYVPGLYGDFGPAVTPEPGIYVFNTGTYYSAGTDIPLLNIPAPFPIEQSFNGFAYINLLRGFFVTDLEFLGARYAIGVRVPSVKIGLDIELRSILGTRESKADTVGSGDLGIIPVSLYWNRGRFYANFYQTVTAPTGEFRPNFFPNASRNHWSIDTVLALSWTDLQKGIEIAAVPGFIVNTVNPATRYRSGNEFHVDYMLNKLLTPTIGIGLHGSYYKQLTDDRGLGAHLGAFKGKASSIGPALLFRPKIAGHQAYFSAKMLHEYNVENRFEGNLYTFTAGIKF